MNVVEKLAAEGHLTDEQVERIGRNVAEVVSAAREDPSMAKEALEKLGFRLPPWLMPGATRTGFAQKAVGHAYDMAPLAIGAAGVGAAMGAGAQVARSGFGAAQDHVAKAQNYKKMLSESPQLAQADPNVVQKAYNTLHRFNPEYASDPLVASTFVQNVVDQERLDIGTVKSLVDARKAMSSQGGRGADFFGAAMGMGGLPQQLQQGQAKGEREVELHGKKMQKAEYETDKADFEQAKAHREYDPTEGRGNE